MRRLFAGLLVAAIAVAATFFEASPTGAPVRNFLSGWLAANALPQNPETIVAIEFPATDRSLPTLDAALILRAVLRYQPRVVGFLAPLRLDGNESLLAGKVAESKIPIVFTSNDRPELLSGVVIPPSLPHLPRLASYVPRGRPAGGLASDPDGHVMIVARQASHAVASNVWSVCMAAEDSKVASGNVPGDVHAGSMFAPVNASGFTRTSSIAAGLVERVTLDQLLLQTERSERGSISTVLDKKFRGRMVVVQPAKQNLADAVASILNHVAERPAWPIVPLAAVLLVATMPWWSASRHTRVLLGFTVLAAWALLALAVCQEFQIIVPLLPLLLLPLLALIPSSRSDKVQ